MHGDVEARVVEDLEYCRVGQQGLEIGRRVVAAVELHEVRTAVAGRELNEAQAVAIDVEAQGLGVDGDARTEREAGRQIVLVQCDGGFSHRTGPSASALGVAGLRWAAVPYTPESFRFGSSVRPRVAAARRPRGRDEA